jgi:hypothetical protein
MTDENRSSSQIVADRLVSVLSAAADRIHYAEGRRSTYVTMAGVLIATSIAIFTFAWGTIEQEILRWSATFAAIAMFLVGSATIWLYGRQTNRYPFTDATKTWKWFYRNALPFQAKFKIPWRAYFNFYWKKTKKEVELQYRDQLPPFILQMKTLSNDYVNLNQDLEQLYTLHVNELYKNLHLSNIRTLFNFGIIFVVLSLVAGAGLGAYLDFREHSERVFMSSSAAYSERVAIRLLNSPLTDVEEFTGEAEISNTGKTPINIGKIIARDRNGWLIPLAISSDPLSPTSVARGQSTTYRFTFTASAAAAMQIKTVEIISP